MKGKARAFLLLLAFASFFTPSCSTQRKILGVKKNALSASLALPAENRLPEIPTDKLEAMRDTLKVQAPDGAEMLIMKAVRDENGEMVATDVIDAAIVTARFRNVAERNGKVDLHFLVTVPSSMLDSKWQLRLVPEMTVMDEKIRLEPVVISGKEFRRAQLKGYEQYRRFINSIITDSTKFIREHELEIFLHRNIPQLYRLKTDSTYISDAQFASIYGVTQRQAVEHYTNQLSAGLNRRKIDRKDRMFERYVKVPIVTEGLRLDTVLTNANGDFIYEYVQTVNTVPELRKVDIAMSGNIYEEDRDIYRIPGGDALTFYISSLSTLIEDRERYLTTVLERRVNANSTYWIDFEVGRSEINVSLGDNGREISRIKDNISKLLENRELELDSIIVTASCSPEGDYSLNSRLSRMRSASVSKYFDNYIRFFRDSLTKDAGLFFNLDETAGSQMERTGRIAFISRNVPENWEMLDSLVAEDPEFPEEYRADFRSRMAISDPDTREAGLSITPYYKHLREDLYPRLRTVRFDFHLHRKGMVKDTVHTTIPDTVYMKGLQAMRDRDYKSAVGILRPYGDYNAAVAFCCMDYNESALSILENLKKNARVKYLLAIVESRKGNYSAAVQNYLDACTEDPSFIHRGNLDPEISFLIAQYGLNNESSISQTP